ncbi:hypothetical protein COCSUDRAFT_61616 [Coccomyxa subellipsoidea C-169]|uniref:Glutaredoxin domain-containing protein n=1 Tax=Coccomyxa subellipsoidea (strain C-169) TaxID=574566 RepID=I0Z428_COCSC|nr:hypothetical protein COCSUDRAFT_61616 [Coccomyxa subellipsoidea C-169]EIE25397.1 hypothetical protein COCSUDRAFT_61616 [Coccomyxa subellipsoidea C-169]|eukprot:XP_005649941.1 hypothetical protein COCSUDRAFT_61616 [Coccomyxa subellipsoidea C-169]
MQVRGLFKELNVDAKFFELDEMADGQDVQDALYDVSGSRTVPQVFVGGTYIGGADDTHSKYRSGELKKIFSDAGVSASLRRHQSDEFLHRLIQQERENRQLNAPQGGLRRKSAVPHMDELGQPDAVPAGDFKYFCVGMGIWDGERMKQNSKQASNPTDPVELPHCEGLEIISATQLQQTPVVLATSATIPSTSEPPREPQRPGPPQKYEPEPTAILSWSKRSGWRSGLGYIP